jgi:hypothetical protein
MFLQQMADLPEVAKPIANHLTDFEVPLYNAWKQRHTPGNGWF